MDVSLGVSCNVDIPGVVRLRRRRSPSIEGQVDGAVSPLLGPRRECRPDFSVPFSYEYTQHEFHEGRLDVESPSESGSTSIEVNRVQRNTPATQTPEMTLSSVCLTDHDPEMVALTPSNYSRLFGSIRTSGTNGSFDKGNETSVLLNSRLKFSSLDNICLTDGCNASRTKSQLDSAIPHSGSQAVDLSKHISKSEITDEISLREARCANGVEIFGSPPTALYGIGPQRQYKDCRSPTIRGKSDIKGSLILAGLFTGVAVIVGTIFGQEKKE